LDWAYGKWSYVKRDYNADGAAKMELIVSLLEKYGAKRLDELFASEPANFLQMFASSATGLKTIYRMAQGQS
jgi:hypothetical protein